MKIKKIWVVGLFIGIIIAGILILLRGQQKIPLVTPGSAQSNQIAKILPSETSKEYADPAGFSFSYPDNLSITKNEIEDNTTYADLQLGSKEVNGSLSLKISDSKFASIDEWIKINKEASVKIPTEVKLGTLKAMEIITKDRLLLGALDQGIFFTIEMPLIEQEFWMKVYKRVISDFSFASQETTTVSSDSVSFEGEEVVE